MKLHDREVERGDKIWSILYGWGTVAMADTDYIEVVFYEDSTKPISIITEKMTLPLKMLFWKEQTLDYSKPLPDLEVDAKVIVWGDEKIPMRMKAHFCKWGADGKIVVYTNGTTNYTCGGECETFENWEIVE